ncbi:HDOD domain-containing protein [Psychromonas sp. SP041]|uniref:HDOD domain-containing protein n=1 Tax=Psychromonas sp. SP041 TaxID=1365007 RepID=UPI0010C77CD3|nr:HDOD domain-containing protein [Psychromonas sp. SP041]
MSKISDALKSSVYDDINEGVEFSLISIPKHLMDIKKICLSSDSSVDEVIEAIERDPGLTGFLIKMANTIHYLGQINSITSIKEACLRMGLRKVGNYAILYATKLMYEIKIKHSSISDEMKRNLREAKKISTSAVESAKKLKQEGLKFDLSEIQTTVSLYFASVLPVYAKAGQLDFDKIITDDIQRASGELRTMLVQSLFKYVGYSSSETEKITFGMGGKIDWLDIVHKEIYLNDNNMVSQSIKERLSHIGFIEEI